MIKPDKSNQIYIRCKAHNIKILKVTQDETGQYIIDIECEELNKSKIEKNGYWSVKRAGLI